MNDYVNIENNENNIISIIKCMVSYKIKVSKISFISYSVIICYLNYILYKSYDFISKNNDDMLYSYLFYFIELLLFYNITNLIKLLFLTIYIYNNGFGYYINEKELYTSNTLYKCVSSIRNISIIFLNIICLIISYNFFIKYPDNNYDSIIKLIVYSYSLYFSLYFTSILLLFYYILYILCFERLDSLDYVSMNNINIYRNRNFVNRINSMITISEFQIAEINEDDCPYCLEKINESEGLSGICNPQHKFHKTCIEKHRLYSITNNIEFRCPLCRVLWHHNV